MGNWNEVLEEVKRIEEGYRSLVAPHDLVRRGHLKRMHNLTGRNVVTYYSGWLSKSAIEGPRIFTITDEDKNGFMACFHQLDRKLGLDLVLHSPGGDVAATESIIDYIRQMFGADVRTFVPQISMSGGTMIALMGREIYMGTHSNLGPIDPQFGSAAALAVLEEFKKAAEDIGLDPSKAAVWRPILEQYPPTFLSKCDHAIKWSEEIAIKTLTSGMFKGKSKPITTAKAIAKDLLSHDVHHTHGRHLHRDDCEKMGLVINKLEKEKDLQDVVLSVHHACMITLMNTNTAKIIENHNGKALLKMLNSDPRMRKNHN